MEGDRKLKRFALACAILIILAAACGTAWSCHATPADARSGGQGTDVPEDDGDVRKPQGGEEPKKRPIEAVEDDDPAGETKREPQGETPPGGEVKDPQETIPGELPEAWDYVEEDEAAVTLFGKEALFGILPEEAFSGLEDGLLAFLKENGEYRRELEVAPETVTASDERTAFRVRFHTARLDGREIAVTHGGGGFEFSLELPEAGGSPEAAGTTEPTEGKGVSE